MSTKIPAIKVKQWLPRWDKVQWSEDELRAQPEHLFYVFSMKARDLKKLSDIYRRDQSTGVSRTEDLGVQRRHDEKRSEKIQNYLLEGYPYCELTENAKKSGEHESLRKPGWLPTGIVINILKPTDARRAVKVHSDELVSITEIDSNLVNIHLPEKVGEKDWKPTKAAPIEIIDGQHRLWAFEDLEELHDFEVPVIAFFGLDISWQAYLFWSINVSPVRINPSLAYDMYPLLRAEDWVQKIDGHKVYKEARAQELVECLWLHEQSPWKNRINMLADPGHGYITQAAWARSLIDAFLKSYDIKRASGGLFGNFKNNLKEILPWTRAQQAAVLIFFGKCLYDAVRDSRAKWVEDIRKDTKGRDLFDQGVEPGMFSSKSLLNTDQGIRGLFRLVNDLCVHKAEQWNLFEWQSNGDAGKFNGDVITSEIDSLSNQKFAAKLKAVAITLADFDWRTSSFEGLTDEERIIKKALRGSGGYVELRNMGLKFLVSNSNDKDLKEAATQILGS